MMRTGPAVLKWRSAISLKEENRDWEGLERKLSRGKLLEVAAVEAGIPLEEAQKWLAERRESHAYDDDSLRILSAKALVAGMNALIRASKKDEGRVSSEGGEFGESFVYHDVDAAKALVASAIKMRGMIGDKKDPAKGGDLFDRVIGQTTSWIFPVQK